MAELCILTSILDRLIDEEPDRKTERFQSQQQLLINLRASVCRDLELLLNTRRPQFSWPKDWQELNTSLVAYGIPDITSKVLDNAELKKQFCKELSDTINHFETRLNNINVTFIANTDDSDRTIHLRITALLIVEPTPEPIIFDSIIEPNSNNIQILAEN